MSPFFTVLVSIIFIIPTMLSNEIYCTTADHCRSDPIECTPNEDCIVHCLGNDITRDACTSAVLHCADAYMCTVHCDGGQACWGMQIYCPNNTECNVITSSGHRSMAYAEIYGGYNGTLNMNNDADDGLEQGTIICPINGDCNIYSKNLLTVTSTVVQMYTAVTFDATSSNTLNIQIEGYNDPLLLSMIYCPMTPSATKTQSNCVINVTDGGDINIGDLLYRTNLYTNEYTDLYLRADAIQCDQCTVEFQLQCTEYQDTCDAVLVNGTNDQWRCVNASKHTQCLTLEPTTSITTANIIDKQISYVSSTSAMKKPYVTSSNKSPQSVDMFMLLSVLIAVLSLVCCLVVLLLCCVIKRRDSKIAKKLQRRNETQAENAMIIPGELKVNVAVVQEEIEGELDTDPADTLNNTIDIIGGGIGGAHYNVNMAPVHLPRADGAQCFQCSSVINNGKIFIENGLFYCQKCCRKGTEGSECESLFGTHPNAVLTKRETPLQEENEFGKCVKCGYIEFGTVSKDGLHCKNCWSTYLCRAISPTLGSLNAAQTRHKPVAKQRQMDVAKQKQMGIAKQRQMDEAKRQMDVAKRQMDVAKQRQMDVAKHKQGKQSFIDEPEAKFIDEPDVKAMEERYGKCVDCNWMKIGRIYEDDYFYCNECWEQYSDSDEDMHLNKVNQPKVELQKASHKQFGNSVAKQEPFKPNKAPHREFGYVAAKVDPHKPMKAPHRKFDNIAAKAELPKQKKAPHREFGYMAAKVDPPKPKKAHKEFGYMAAKVDPHNQKNAPHKKFGNVAAKAELFKQKKAPHRKFGNRAVNAEPVKQNKAPHRKVGNIAGKLKSPKKKKEFGNIGSKVSFFNQQRQSRKCMECGCMKLGKADETGSFYCTDCWNDYHSGY